MNFINFFWQYGLTAIATYACAWCISWGGRAERLGAIILLTEWLLSMVVQSHDGRGPGIWVQIIDVITLGLFVGLSLWSRKVWSIFLAALQLDTVVGHAAAHLAGFGVYPYAVAAGLWGGEGVLIAVVAGTISHRRSERRRWARLEGAKP
ncbi:hypothetical protein [Asticcacaulis solisilvae]|uniref:hypothetical protein n=1 Tax=Asticcacaulis solisilvae TaxID=1217274 RepID=UPI003FD7DDEF